LTSKATVIHEAPPEAGASEGVGLTSKATVIHEAPPDGSPPLNDDEVLDDDEVRAAIDALSPEDMLKLDGIEKIRRRGTRFGPGALLQEAIYRTLEGDRHCPRRVSFMAFLPMTMKSIASHDREQYRKILQQQRGRLPPWQNSPEDHLIEQEMVTRIHDLFSYNTELQRVIQGWIDGLKGRELRDALGLDQAKYDYAVKLIKKKIVELYPDWWTSRARPKKNRR
jgi:hypothetical protein